MKIINNLFTPFAKVDKTTYTAMIAIQIAVALILLQLFPVTAIPTPTEIFTALINLVTSPELFDNLITSMWLVIEGMIIAIITTMIIVYASRLIFFKPISVLISKFRYLTLTGITFLFTMHSDNTHSLKMKLLLFGIIPFFVTSFMSVVDSIPQYQIDKAFINRKTPWEALYEVVIVGRLDQLLEVVRQNFAISWMMITSVEAYTLNEGGLGTMMIKSNRTYNMPVIFALLIIVLCIGLFTDFALSKIRKTSFKYI